jgi:putative membrane-bound dehydrogenase-like protein
MRWPLSLFACWILLATGTSAYGQKEFGFVNTQPSGQPYLTPEESLRRMQVPPEFEIKVFAAEPDIINPIAFSVDERGRLWVVECYEYPSRTPPGRMPRDRIKVLEDTDGDGKADKVTLWAEGKDLPRFDMASGIEVGNGGVYLGAAPYLMFLQDTRKEGKCDHYEILLKGFGSEDTHEVLNTFQWGPDGQLYGLHGIFTESKIDGVQMDAAVWRYNTRSKKFGIFAEGTSNPWGLDFDPHGQAFLTACVIPHAFHMIPGGTYIRQSGASKNPYAYGLLNEISDHTHHAESGWAHAGALVLQGSRIPEQYRGSLLMGSIHGTSIKRDELGRRGSTYVARHAPDFLVSGDKNFRPVNLRWGPDGSIYIIDWHDQNPCHQAKPTSWDMTHGRIYKIQRKGLKPGAAPDLGKLTTQELLASLQSDDPWRYRTALRLLNERQDPSIHGRLYQLIVGNEDEAVRLRALWALYTTEGFHEDVARKVLQSPNPWLRLWGVQLLGEQPALANACTKELVDMAEKEPTPEVRLAIACAAQQFRPAQALGCVHGLMKHAGDLNDPCLPLMIWLATEPLVQQFTEELLGWMAHTGTNNRLISEYIWPRAVRRTVVDRQPAHIALCLNLVRSSENAQIRTNGLQGVLQGLGERPTDLPAAAAGDLTVLEADSNAEVRRLAKRLAVRFHIRQAIENALHIAGDSKLPILERLESLHDLAAVRPPEAIAELESLLDHEKNEALRVEVLRVLTGYSETAIANRVIADWKGFSPAVRVEAINLLASRLPWAKLMLGAIARKEIAQTDLNNNVVVRLTRFRDAALNKEIERVWGKLRQGTPAELDALIERKRGELAAGSGSMSRGKLIFAGQCSKCHRFQGEGFDVGPALDGAGRDLDYLLTNVFDPNRVVGQPYFQNLVVLNNGRVENGLRAGEDADSITLKAENNALKTIAKKDIQELTVQPKSLMPEGLEKVLSPQDLRDLFRYVMANPFLVDITTAGPLSSLESSSLDPSRPATLASLPWKKTSVGVSGGIPLPAPGPAGDAITYLSAEFDAKSALKTQLLLGGSVTLKVWIDGRQIYDGRPSQRPAAPDQATVPVELSAGKHRLIVRASYRGGKEAVYLRFVDGGRQLTYRE